MLFVEIMSFHLSITVCVVARSSQLFGCWFLFSCFLPHDSDVWSVYLANLILNRNPIAHAKLINSIRPC